MGNDQEYMRIHAFIGGRVQGVGFRMFVLEHAQLLGATGWVRNTWQGQVEVTAEGPRRVLDKFVTLLRKGPPSAIVEDIQVDWQPYSGQYNRFDVRRTE